MYYFTPFFFIRQDPARFYSKKSFSFLLRLGWRNLRKALASICRIRSLVTPKTCPTSSRVLARPSSNPKRRRKTFSSREVRVLRTLPTVR